MNQNKEMTIEDKVAEAFKGKKMDYERVFQKIYPANGSNGFTERNQTFFFTHNYLKLHPEAICWQEVPFGKKEHIDTLIIDGKSIIYIEAKRISGKHKEQHIIDDIERLLIPENREIITKGLNKQEDSTEYVLYLADVWAETDYKSSVKNNWGKDESFLKKIGLEKKLQVIASNIHTFDAENIKEKATLEKYNIAYSLFRL